MASRETIAYDKDLITGQVQTLKKYKDSDSPMINTTTIELFDAETGEKVHEAKSENIINNNVAKLAYMDFFYQKIKGSTTNAYYTSPFQTLVLTNYSGAEDANDWVTKGAIVGYADKQTGYVGSDVTRGTINTSESVLTEASGSGYLHFVFDFPTHAANGTFNTVWWTKDILFTLIAINNGISGLSSSNIRTFIKGGYIDITNNIIPSLSIPVYAPNTLLNTNVTVNPLNLPTTITAAGAGYDNTNVWIVDYTRLKINKFTDDMSSWISSTSITGWNTLWGTTINDITILNAKIYAITNFYNIVIIDILTGACLSSTDIRLTIGALSTATTTNGGITTDGISKILITYNNQITILDFNLGYIGYCSGVGNYRMAFDKDRYSIICFASGGTVYRYLPLYVSPGAQNLLAAPITKTTSFTMKITYDFQIQKLW